MTMPPIIQANKRTLTASKGMIIPMAADAYSLQGLSQLNGLVGSIRKYCNPDLQIYGLLLARYNDRQTVSRALADMIQRAADQLETIVFNTRIREAVAVREAALVQSDFFTEAPKSNATQDYNSFLDEFMEVLSNGSK